MQQILEEASVTTGMAFKSETAHNRAGVEIPCKLVCRFAATVGRANLPLDVTS